MAKGYQSRTFEDMERSASEARSRNAWAQQKQSPASTPTPIHDDGSYARDKSWARLQESMYQELRKGGSNADALRVSRERVAAERAAAGPNAMARTRLVSADRTLSTPLSQYTGKATHHAAPAQIKPPSVASTVGVPAHMTGDKAYDWVERTVTRGGKTHKQWFRVKKK